MPVTFNYQHLEPDRRTFACTKTDESTHEHHARDDATAQGVDLAVLLLVARQARAVRLWARGSKRLAPPQVSYFGQAVIFRAGDLAV